MANVSPAFSALPGWHDLYKAALFETNRERLPARIAEAERALVLRARELFAMTGDHIEEEQALEDALYALKALQSCLGLHTVEPHAA
jgi:hypothetical protein